MSVRGGRFSFLLYRTSEMSLYKEYITVDVDGGGTFCIIVLGNVFVTLLKRISYHKRRKW